VFLEFEKSVRKCSEQYEGVYSAVGFQSTTGFGMLQNLLSARKRGVRVRIITEVNAQNLEVARRYSKLLEIRSHESVSQGMRFSIIDRSKIIMALSDAPTSGERATCLCSSMPTLARGLGLYFEQMWKESREVLEPMRRPLRKGVGV